MMALKQALSAAKRSGSDVAQIVHHSDRGSQYVSESYTQELKELGVRLSVGSTGDSYDNALVESVNGAYKAELVRGCLFDSVARLEAENAGWVWRWSQGLGGVSDAAGDDGWCFSVRIIIGTKASTYQFIRGTME